LQQALREYRLQSSFRVECINARTSLIKGTASLALNSPAPPVVNCLIAIRRIKYDLQKATSGCDFHAGTPAPHAASAAQGLRAPVDVEAVKENEKAVQDGLVRLDVGAHVPCSLLHKQ
jgi:hypothetical protein